jgi:hypothetical protein
MLSRQATSEQIQNPNIEIRNKPKHTKPKAKNGKPKRVGLEFCAF